MPVGIRNVVFNHRNLKGDTQVVLYVGLLSLSLKIAIDLLNRTDDGLEHLRDEYDFIIGEMMCVYTFSRI